MHVFLNSLPPRINRFRIAVFCVGVLWRPAPPAMADFTVSEGKSVLIGNSIKTSAHLDLNINGEPAVALSKGIS